MRHAQLPIFEDDARALTMGHDLEAATFGLAWPLISPHLKPDLAAGVHERRQIGRIDGKELDVVIAGQPGDLHRDVDTLLDTLGIGRP